MTVYRQLLVRHRGLDPTAWTALHALVRLAPEAQPAALARAAVWEFEWEDGSGLERRLAEWVGEANWFANPNRDRAVWRRAAGDPTEIAAGAALASGGVGSEAPGAYLLTTWRGDQSAPAHAAAATRALDRPVRVRRGQLWWLAASTGDAAAVLEAAGARAGGGLLANPHSEAARLCAQPLAVPLLGDEAGGLAPTPRQGGAG